MKHTRAIGALAALCLLTTLPVVADAKTDMGNRATPGERLPVGEYKCGLGSYKGRTCTMLRAKAYGGFTLTVPADKGHSFPFKGQVLGSDDADQLIVVGKLLKPNRICSDDEPADCLTQEITVILTKTKKGTWRGNMRYWIYRTDDKGRYRHGVTEVFTIRPKKR